MKAYMNDEQRPMAVSLIVTVLGMMAIISSPFIFNLPAVFYICVVLTIIAGLYLSRSITYKQENTPQGKKKRAKTGRPKRR